MVLHIDAHLENAILQINSEGVYSAKLIGYSQIHHKDFTHCKGFDCFSSNPLKRINEDLANDFNGKLGMGFRADIIALQIELKADNSLIRAFDECYKININY